MHQKIDDIQNDLATQHFFSFKTLGVKIQLLFNIKISFKTHHSTSKNKYNARYHLNLKVEFTNLDN